MTARRLLASAVALGLLTACTGGDPGDGDGPGDAAPSSASRPPGSRTAETPETPAIPEEELRTLEVLIQSGTPEPLGDLEVTSVDVDVTLDAAAAVTSTVPVTGGTVSTTAADGTAYTLDVGPDALLFDTAVTMTPVTTVATAEGGPVQVLGVQLEPDGLRLHAAATLRVQPAVEVGDPRAYTYRADGEDLHSSPVVDTDPGAVALPVTHFSGRIVYLTSDTAPGELVGETWEGQLESGLAAGQGIGALDAAYDAPVSAALAALRSGGCAEVRGHLGTAVGWLGMATAMGLLPSADPRQQEVLDAAIAAVQRCWEELTDGCVDRSHAALLRVLRALARQSEILGGPTLSVDAVADASPEVCGILSGELLWRRSYNARPSAHGTVRATEIVVASLGFGLEDDEWDGRFSRFSWYGTESRSEVDGPCKTSSQRHWSGSGGFTEEGEGVFLSLDDDVVSLEVYVTGQMSGIRHHTGVDPPNGGGPYHCPPEHSVEQFEQGGPEWAQQPWCPAVGDVLTGSMKFEGLPIYSFECSGSDAGSLNDGGDYSEEVGVFGYVRRLT